METSSLIKKLLISLAIVLLPSSVFASRFVTTTQTPQLYYGVHATGWDDLTDVSTFEADAAKKPQSL